MNPSDDEEVVFEAALQLTAHQRAAYLDQTCGGDTELRRRVDALLGAFERAGGFLKEPAVPGHARTVAVSLPPTEKPGDRIGHYKLLEQIGEGGCGVVYMAEQEEPVRRGVALKVIKLGMDTKQVIARFEAERQALALMDHPNIAKVFDAGATHTGRPFFVMELVRGTKITDYCDANQLSTGQRLDLFVQVCHAIQHAHQKGLIHRDIKPSNILVTLRDGVAVPKVIDFGIAKATTDQLLTDKTLFTAFEQFLGTPAYMSPEQAELSELGIDTRSDIYSLGVLLYELLTGQTPFDAKELLQEGLDAMRRTIRETEPARPSTRLSTMLAGELTQVAKHRQAEPSKLPGLIRGDLDWIVMKCLEKDRARRYDTANGLASDVQRYLADEPVVARPPGKFYRFQKLVRRNKLVFGAISAVGVALLLGLALSTWLLVKERAARQSAVAAQQKAQQVASFLKKMLQGVGPSKALGRDSAMLGEILGQTAKSVGQDLTNQPEVAVELYLILADTYRDLGLYKEMERVSRQSLRLARSRLGAENQGVADSLQNVGAALMHQHSNLEEAEQCSRDSLAMCQRLLGNENARVADALAHLAIVLTVEGKLGEAEALQRKALAMYRKLFGEDRPEAAKLLRDLAITLEGQSDRLAEAENLDREALAAQRRLLGDLHPEVVKSVNFLGEILSHQGRLLEAEAKHREALAMWRKLLAGDRFEVLRALQRLTLVLMGQNKLAEAETRMREALAMQSKVQADETLAAEWLDNLAGLLFQKGMVEEAESKYGEALAIRRKLLGNEAVEVAWSFENQAALFRWQGRLEEAETKYRQALAIERKEFGELDSRVADITYHLAIALKKQSKPEADALFNEAAEHMNVQAINEHAWQLATVADAKSRDGTWAVALAEKAVAATNRKDPAFLDTLAAAYAEAGRFIDAVSVQQEAMALVQNSEDTHGYAARLRVYEAVSPYRDPGLMDELDRAMLLQGKFAEAEATARECLALRERLLSDDWRTFDTRSLLGASLAGLKQFPEAESFLVAVYEGLEQRKGQLPAEAQERLTDAARRLAEFYEVTGQAEKATECRKREVLAQATAQSAPEAAARRADGVYAARHGRFNEAAADFARVIELRPDDHEVWHWQAVTLVQLGQLEAYRELRRRSLERFANTTDPNTAERVAKDVLLVPASGPELETASKMADVAVNAEGNHADMDWFRCAKGLAEYRQGRFVGAEDWTQKVLSHAGNNFSRDVEAYMVLAMADYRSKQTDEARTALAKGVELAERTLPKLASGDLGDGWFDWIIAHVLMREAKALIEGMPPAATESKSKPR